MVFRGADRQLDHQLLAHLAILAQTDEPELSSGISPARSSKNHLNRPPTAPARRQSDQRVTLPANLVSKARALVGSRHVPRRDVAERVPMAHILEPRWDLST